MNIAHPVKLRPGKQKPLETANTGGFQPAPLLQLLNAFRHQRDLKVGAAAHYRSDNRLFWAAEMNIADNFPIDLDFIRLEASKQ